MSDSFSYFPNHYANGGWWHLMSHGKESIEIRSKREALRWLKERGASEAQLNRISMAMKFRDEVSV